MTERWPLQFNPETNIHFPISRDARWSLHCPDYQSRAGYAEPKPNLMCIYSHTRPRTRSHAAKQLHEVDKFQLTLSSFQCIFAMSVNWISQWNTAGEEHDKTHFIPFPALLDNFADSATTGATFCSFVNCMINSKLFPRTTWCDTVMSYKGRKRGLSLGNLGSLCACVVWDDWSVRR